MMTKRWVPWANKYKTDKRGQFAVWTAIAAVPVLLVTGLAIDFGSAEADKNAVKQALDVAVLASVSNNLVSDAEKEKIAIDVFNKHYTGSVKLALAVETSDGRVSMNAKGLKEASVSRAAGMKGFDVNTTSTAIMNRQNTICVLALAANGKNKLRFLDATRFNSPTCSVQSNSTDPQGAMSKTKYTPIAKSFCAAGGATGDFEPSIRGECAAVIDPYEKLKVPESGVCMPQNIFQPAPNDGAALFTSALTMPPNLVATNHFPSNPITPSGSDKHTHQHCHILKPGETTSHCHVGTHKVETLHAPEITDRLSALGVGLSDVQRLVSDYGLEELLVQESFNYTGSNSVFYPGTYCGGLTVDGTNVTFMPGIYIMKDGPLTFKNGASANAQEVSFILKGPETVLTVESGSYVTIKAPKSGEMAGLAIYQDRYDDIEPAKSRMSFSQLTVPNTLPGTKEEGDGSKMPTAVNLISSGGELNVTGTLYLPTQALDILGESVLGAKAPATSFIAHQVTFAGETEASVSVDHVKGNIPVMQPFSDDGARLIE